MIRTQIYLPENINIELTELAKKEATSKSELVREAVFSFIAKKTKPKEDAYKFLKNFIAQGAKSGKKLPKDIVDKHTDYYLDTVLKGK